MRSSVLTGRFVWREDRFRMRTLSRVQFIPRSIESVWALFAEPGNLNEMTPPFLEFEIVSGAEVPMFAGQVIEYRIRILPGVRQRWVTEITHCVERSYFVDEQRIGPYRMWRHLHRFEESNTERRIRTGLRGPAVPRLLLVELAGEKGGELVQHLVGVSPHRDRLDL